MEENPDRERELVCVCLSVNQLFILCSYIFEGVMAVMMSPAYHGYAGTHLPIAEQEVGLQEVELCI